MVLPLECKTRSSEAIALGSSTEGLFFVRFWKVTGDRLFLSFALAFFGEVVSRIWMALSAVSSEEDPSIYMLRFISYGLIGSGNRR